MSDRTSTIPDEDVLSFLDALDALPTAEPVATVATVPTVATAPDRVPLASRPVAQGDLLFVPEDVQPPHWIQPLHGAVVLVEDGNGHQLTPEGPVDWAVIHGDPHVIGVVRVGPGGFARIEQPRGEDAHHPLALGPGVWTIRRQVEYVAPAVRRRVID